MPRRYLLAGKPIAASLVTININIVRIVVRGSLPYGSGS